MTTKIHLNLEKTLRKHVILIFLRKNLIKTFADSKKKRTFATANPKRFGATLLGYGVMVTLQILVLSFLVRIRVSQQ